MNEREKANRKEEKKTSSLVPHNCLRLQSAHPHLLLIDHTALVEIATSSIFFPHKLSQVPVLPF